MLSGQTVLQLAAKPSAAAGRPTLPTSEILGDNLLLLPVLVVASLVALVASFVLPRLYRYVRKHVFRPAYELVRPADDRADHSDPRVVDDDPSPGHYMPSNGITSDFWAYLASMREYGSVLFALEVLRLLCLAALLGLTIWAAVQAEPPREASLDDGQGDFRDTSKSHKKHKNKNKHKHKHDTSLVDDYSLPEVEEFGLCIFYVGVARGARPVLTIGLYPTFLRVTALPAPRTTISATSYRSS